MFFTAAGNNNNYDTVVQRAEHFIIERYVKGLPSGFSSPPVVHIIKSEVDTESVGHVLCKKADELHAACMVMASHNKGRMVEFFLGSVTNYCTHHSKRPVIVIPSTA